MKKTYINPEMVIIRIATQQMLALSAGVDQGGSPINPGDMGAPSFGPNDLLPDLPPGVSLF